jgi:hypothetical protein
VILILRNVCSVFAVMALYYVLSSKLKDIDGHAAIVFSVLVILNKAVIRCR